jgi:hypothetical protein
MSRMTQCARVLVTSGLLAASNVGEMRAENGSTLVAVLPLASEDEVDPSRATHELAQAVTSGLRSAGFRVVVAGSPTAAPLEELAAVANARGVDVAVGVRSSSTLASCAVVLTPHAESRPPQTTLNASQAQLAANLKQLIAAIRYEASARLASSMESSGQGCVSKPAEGDSYVLQAVAAPTILLLVPVSEQGQVTRRLPAVIQDWAAAERARK